MTIFIPPCADQDRQVKPVVALGGGTNSQWWRRLTGEASLCSLLSALAPKRPRILKDHDLNRLGNVHVTHQTHEPAV